MREIKFRVWDGIKYSTQPRLELILLNCQPKECSIVGLGKIIQQFTGIKDKNEKDIYEGDILERKENDIVYKKEIYWNVGQFIGIEDIVDGSKFYNEKWEIVGNIFENPQLLSQEKLSDRIKESDENIDKCEQCGDYAWDGYLCHNCGLKKI